MSFESIPGKGVAEQGPLALSTSITESSTASEVVDFLRMPFELMNLCVDQEILTDRENALKAEIENLRKANEQVLEFENWKMRAKREMEELKAEKKEVEGRLKASEDRYVWLEGRVARMEENVVYVGSRLLRKDDDEVAAENDGLAFGATKVGGNSSPKKEGKSEMRLGPEMNEANGESLQRKRMIGNDDDDGDNSSISVRKRKPHGA